jgi:hypothetical protein
MHMAKKPGLLVHRSVDLLDRPLPKYHHMKFVWYTVHVLFTERLSGTGFYCKGGRYSTGLLSCLSTDELVF